MTCAQWQRVCCRGLYEELKLFVVVDSKPTIPALHFWTAHCQLHLKASDQRINKVSLTGFVRLIRRPGNNREVNVRRNLIVPRASL
jgi:hypothetical protein